MTSDRHDDRRREGGAVDPDGQGGQPMPKSGRDTQLREELRARMRAIEAGNAAPKSALGPAATRPQRLSSPDEAADDDADIEPDEGPAEERTTSERSTSETGRRGGFSGGFGSKRSGLKPSASKRFGSKGFGSKPFASKSSGNSGFGGQADGPERSVPGGSAWPEADRFEAQLALGGADPLDPASAEDRPSALFDESLSRPDGSGRGQRRRAPREQSPTQRALGLLTRREHSRKELTRKLTSRGLDAGEVETAVAQLAEAGWQNDVRFAESMVRSRAGNGYGPLHIRAELATHGLDSQTISDALASYEGDWLQNARDLVRRRYGEDFAADPARRRKAADLLMRRGFDGDTARNANRSGSDD